MSLCDANRKKRDGNANVPSFIITFFFLLLLLLLMLRIFPLKHAESEKKKFEIPNRADESLQKVSNDNLPSTN